MFDRFLCIGSISYDLIFQIDRLPHPHEKLRCPDVHQSVGGSAANTAHWLARLGHKVSLAGCVGDDAFGHKCVAELNKVGVNTDFVQVAETASTGIATIFSSPTDKRMVTARGANGCFDPSRLPLDELDQTVHVHLSVGDDRLALPILTEASRRGASVSCEFNGGQFPERVPFCRICFMNYDELCGWMGHSDPLSRWRQRFQDSVTSLVVTQGERGAVCQRQAQTTHAEAECAEVVDRTGGGDAFDAGYLHGAHGNLDTQACLQSGLKLAALAISHLGATPPQVSDQQLSGIGRSD